MAASWVARGRQLAGAQGRAGRAKAHGLPSPCCLELPAAAEAPAPAAVVGKACAPSHQKKPEPARDVNQTYTDWTFGELPELLEVKKADRPDRLPGP